MSTQSDNYRKNADDCRAQAEKAVSALDRERWLKLAEEWLRLAQAEDQRDPPRTDPP
jgi:hypothetical protein